MRSTTLLANINTKVWHERSPADLRELFFIIFILDKLGEADNISGASISERRVYPPYSTVACLTVLYATRKRK